MTVTRHAAAGLMVVTPYVRDVSPDPVFYEDFQTTALAWTGIDADLSVSRVFNAARGRWELRTAFTNNTPAGNIVNSGVVGGLVVGKRYRIVAHAYSPSGAVDIEVHFLPSNEAAANGGRVTLTPGAVREQWSATTLALPGIGDPGTLGISLLMRSASPGVVYWTDVAIYEAELTPYLPLTPTSCSVTLDESWSPYARATLTCPLPSGDALRRIDPRSGQRATLTLASRDSDSWIAADLTALYAGETAATLTAAFAGKTAAFLTSEFALEYNGTVDTALNVSRTFDLQVRTRTLDHVAGTMTLELTSDEMYLQDWGRYETFTPALRPPVTSDLHTLVTWGLSFIGATLAAGSSTATIDPAAVLWNLGESLWSFLDAFVRPAGLRLWCDEQRVWRLTPPLTGASGTATVSALTEFTDTLSRDGGYGNVAVVKWEWTDETTGEVRSESGYSGTQYLGTPYVKTVVQVVEKPAPTAPPPPGEFVPSYSLLTRVSSRGREASIAAVSDYRITPGQAAQIATPAAVVSGAMVSAVTWDLPADEMRLTTRDIVA